MPGTTSVAASGDQDIDGLLYNRKWAVNSFTFSFPTSASFYTGNSAPNGEASDNFGVLNANQQTYARWALQQYSSVINVTFSEMTETSSQHADLRFAKSDAPQTAWAYYPSSAAYGGDSWYNNSGGSYDNPIRGNYAAHTFLHEIGHAMGLEHGHDPENPWGALPTEHDSLEYSVMTYRTYAGGPTNGYTYGTWSAPQTLMQNDIAALQYLYGANFNTNNGNTVYTWSSTTGQQFVDGAGQGPPGGNKIFMTVWDGGGTDTYDFSNYSSNLSINLQPGLWTTLSTTQLASLGSGHVAAGNVANALLYNNDVRSLIENAIGGSGNDTIVGNIADNHLHGSGGDDVLYGDAGDDLLWGDDGSDRFIGDSGADVFTGGNNRDTADYSGAGSGVTVNLDTGIGSGGDAAGDLYGSIEDVFGSGFADTLTGDNADNRLYGAGDDDVLAGGTGNNALYGDDGSDRFIGGTGADAFNGGNGRDTADYAGSNAGVTVNLGTGAGSNGYAQGDLYGSIEDVFGSGFADILTGDNADNRLYGADGDDVLAGGTGNSALYGDDGSDRFIGGTGADAFNGGNGRDTADYSGSNAGVTVNLATGAGSNGYAQGDLYGSIEEVIGSAFADNIVGDNADNRLFGLNGNDFLHGGSGGDTLFGGDGDDLLWGDDGEDHFMGDAGADVFTGGSGGDIADYSGASGAITVNLATGTGSGNEAAGDLYGSVEIVVGSEFGDVLIGDSSDNQLSGLGGNDVLVGGTGADLLSGGLGSDFFTFVSVTDSFASGIDQILDLTASESDMIDLSQIDADAGTNGDQAFDYIGASSFSSVAGQLRFEAGMVEADVDGDGIADFALVVSNANLGATDFIL